MMDLQQTEIQTESEQREENTVFSSYFENLGGCDISGPIRRYFTQTEANYF